jgi:hypothetical protein
VVARIRLPPARPHNPRTSRCQTGGLVLDRDEHSAVNYAPMVPPIHTRAIPCDVRPYALQLKDV